MSVELDVGSGESFYVIHTLHEQELTVSPGYAPGKDGCISIWVAESDAEWPLVLESRADAIRLANMLLEAVLEGPGPDLGHMCAPEHRL